MTMWDPDKQGPRGLELVVGGKFEASLGRGINLSLWNNGIWSSIGAPGMTGNDTWVMALAVDTRGDLWVGGKFDSIGGVPAKNIARWDGIAWYALGSGVEYSQSVAHSDDQWPDGVRSIAVLPNGHVVVGGLFSVAGGVSANNIARWDGSAWSSLGNGVTRSEEAIFSYARVHALAVLSDGRLAVGGRFDLASNAPGGSNPIVMSNLAVWNPATASWSSLGGGVARNIPPDSLDHNEDHAVFALAAGANGRLAVGGYFKHVNVLSGQSTQLDRKYVAMLDTLNNTWNTLGADTSPMNEEVMSVVFEPSGNLLVGGGFSWTNGQPLMRGLARWNVQSQQWSDLHAQFGSDEFAGGDELVTCIVHVPTTNGELIYAGGFMNDTAGGRDGIARWDGSTWSDLGSPELGETLMLGDSAGRANAFVRLDDGSIVAAGVFNSAGGVACNNIARWDGQSWTPLGVGVYGEVYCMTLIPKPNSMGMGHDLMIGGVFDTTGDGLVVNNVAVWNGSAWTRADNVASNDPNIVGFYGAVRALVVVPGMDMVIAGGEFSRAGTSTARCLAFLDSTTRDWDTIKDLNGDPLIDIFGSYGSVRALVWTNNGSPTGSILYVGGFIDYSNNNGLVLKGIVRVPLNNPGWYAVGTGLGDGVYTLAIRPNYRVIAGGPFDYDGNYAFSLNHIAEWNGSTWTSFADANGIGLGGNGNYVNTIILRPNGNVIAAGNCNHALGGAYDANNIAEWNGSSWQPLGAPANNGVVPSSSTNAITAVLAIDDKELLISGQFQQAWGKNVRGLARWSSDGTPVFVLKPVAGCVGHQNAVVIAVEASGYDFGGAVSYMWKKDGELVTDGQPFSGGTFSGSTTRSLLIQGYTSLDMGEYTLTVTNSCGSTESIPVAFGSGASLTYCPADINHSCSVTVQDIFDFLDAWFAGDLQRADFDSNGTIAVQDIFDFLAAWFAGC